MMVLLSNPLREFHLICKKMTLQKWQSSIFLANLLDSWLSFLSSWLRRASAAEACAISAAVGTLWGNSGLFLGGCGGKKILATFWSGEGSSGPGLINSGCFHSLRK